MTEQQEISVEDELWQIEDKTQSDGTVLGEILYWNKLTETIHSPKIVAHIRLPNGQRFKQRYEWPASADPDEYEFVRLVEHCGYSLSSADMIEGMEVPCRRNDGEWTIHVPQSTVSKAQEHGMGLLRTILAPVTMLWYWPYMVREERMADDTFDYIMMTAGLLAIWIIAALGALLIAGIGAEVVGWLL